MFGRVLIANRGEVAVRVVRACHDLGITAVALCSEADRDALHVRMADEAVELPGNTALETYLALPAVTEAVVRSGADAVHPGYGFLSEQAAFARAVAGVGAVFVGPSPEALDLMGDKVSARRVAAAAGVAAVPGTDAPLRTADEVRAFGAAHGWPVAVKAAHGGGGRGLRVVAGPDDADEAVAAAAREAAAAFGRPELYLERYLARPRHVEVQVFADAHGHVVALGERDCSVQRRHQKLVEEAPAPGLPDDLRRALGEAAVAVARACGYVNAGTVEFLVEDGRFWFLEVNARLQVEHPVTELVTGFDLVVEQLRVAAGEPLSFASGTPIAVSGHAIEVRVNAEDVAGGRFVPTPGTITRFVAPGGFGVRFDAGYDAGSAVPPYYDSLLGKLVAWGDDREQARIRLLRALGELEITGVPTTIPVVAAVLAHPAFVTATHATAWLEQALETDLAAAVAEVPDPAGPPAAGAFASAIPSRDLVDVGGRTYWIPRFDGLTAAAAAPVPASAPPASAGATTWRARRTGAASVDGRIVAPMQATVVRLAVAVGDAVEPGATVIVLEAMKMEQALTSDRPGTVTEVHVAPGTPVAPGALLIVIT